MIHELPYTDMHELNLDWFLAKFKELVEEWNQVQGEWDSLHDYVQNYFDNLNVQTEIDNKINAMIADGSFAIILTPLVEAALPTIVDGKLPAVVASQIGAVVAAQIGAVVAGQLPAVAASAAAQEVSGWLAAHIDPDTGYVIDDTLTVSQAAADAKVTGDNIRELNLAVNNIIPYINKGTFYLYKKDTVISSGSEITLSNYNLYKIPVNQGDIVFLSSVNKWWNTLSDAYIFNFQNNDDSYTNISNTSAYAWWSGTYFKAIFIIPANVKYLTYESYDSYADDVIVNINNIKRNINNGIGLYNTVTVLNSDNTFNAKGYRKPDGTFGTISGSYYCLSMKIKKDDILIFDSLPGTLTSYGTFTDSSDSTISISTAIFKATTDGLVNIINLDHDNCTYYPADILKINDNKFLGLSGVAFGTSLTYRALTTGGYLKHLSELSGITFDNQGVSGATILNYTGIPCMLPTIMNYTGYADKRIAILEGFCNDWYYNTSTLGTWKDTTTDSVCGCIRNAINHMWDQNPDLTIYLILDHFGKGISAPDAVNTANMTQFEYYQEIEKVALSMGVRVIREYELSEINPKTDQYLLDNIHLNPLGASQSAESIWSVIKTQSPNLI